tara:strand:+ start:354 stop:578 length:225 start_codon:yes stop_codon:yes gene_type:complete
MGDMTTRQVKGQMMEIKEGDKVRLSDGRTANVLSVITAPGWDNMLLVDEGHMTKEGFSMGTNWQHVHAEDVEVV